MARIKGKDLYLNNDDQIYFGDNQEGALWYDNGELQLNHTISGTAAIEGYHLIQKQQVEELVSDISFLDLTDTPTSYDTNKYLRSTASGIEFAIVEATPVVEYPRYYIESGLTILLNNYGQYTINETGYIEVAGTLSLGIGSMVIVQRREI